MKLTIKREELLKALNIASRAVSSKVVNPVLKNLKFELDERGLNITGSDNDISIKTLIPYARNEQEIIRNYKEGEVLIGARLITEITRKVEGDEITLDIIDSTIADISTSDNKSHFTLECVAPNEYPDLDLESSGTQITLTKEDFSLLVSQTAFAASVKEQRPVLTAINLEAANGVITATATDSARMARKTLPVPEGVEFVSNVPARMMVEVDHLLEGENEVTISFSDKKALFAFGNTVVATRLIDSEYPNTKNIVPHITNYKLEVVAEDLMKAIDRANILSMDRENVVDISMGENGIEITSKSSQVGSASEKLESYKYEGEQLRISFNSEFVLAAIRALGSQDVTFAFVGEMKPFVIKNASDDSVIQIVTPVRSY